MPSVKPNIRRATSDSFCVIRAAKNGHIADYPRRTGKRRERKQSLAAIRFFKGSIHGRSWPGFVTLFFLRRFLAVAVGAHRKGRDYQPIRWLISSPRRTSLHRRLLARPQSRGKKVTTRLPARRLQ